jgi:hypothetical protein
VSEEVGEPEEPETKIAKSIIGAIRISRTRRDFVKGCCDGTGRMS